jgi:hypothetical protein
MQNMILQHGGAVGSGVAAEGGAIYNQGTLILMGVKVDSNVAEADKNRDAQGGGIWSNGSVTLEDLTLPSGTVIHSTLVDNFVHGGPYGGSQPYVPGGSAFGGGLYVAGGTANLTGATIAANQAVGGSGNYAQGNA